jgi:hypothetical protein
MAWEVGMRKLPAMLHDFVESMAIHPVKRKSAALIAL